jgi:hypothetical protein
MVFEKNRFRSRQSNTSAHHKKQGMKWQAKKAAVRIGGSAIIEPSIIKRYQLISSGINGSTASIRLQ